MCNKLARSTYSATQHGFAHKKKHAVSVGTCPRHKIFSLGMTLNLRLLVRLCREAGRLADGPCPFFIGSLGISAFMVSWGMERVPSSPSHQWYGPCIAAHPTEYTRNTLVAGGKKWWWTTCRDTFRKEVMNSYKGRILYCIQGLCFDHSATEWECPSQQCSVWSLDPVGP